MKKNFLLNLKEIIVYIENIMIKIIIFFIEIYKKYFSPIFTHFGIHCKYYPTCSEYAKQAIKKYGIIKGSGLSLRRFLKCNPFSKGGYDPVK